MIKKITVYVIKIVAILSLLPLPMMTWATIIAGNAFDDVQWGCAMGLFIASVLALIVVADLKR